MTQERSSLHIQIRRRVAKLKMQDHDIAMYSEGQNRYRLTNAAGNDQISPFLSGRQMMDWLTAYEVGWERGKETGISEMRKGRIA